MGFIPIKKDIKEIKEIDINKKSVLIFSPWNQEA